MPKVEFDLSQLQKYANELENLAKKELDSFLRESTLMLAAEFMKRVVDRTPRGEYPDKIEFTTRKGKQVSFDNPIAGKQGGHLQSSWKLGVLIKTSDGYEIDIYNDATTETGESYASHVEYGHRKMNKKGGEVKGWVEGKFMMTHTEIEMAFIAPELLEQKLEAFLRQVLGDG